MTFDQLPEAMALLLEKVSRIEVLLAAPEERAHGGDELLTIRQAAELLNTSVASLYTKVSRREIPVHKPGKRLYFSKKEITDWVLSHRVKTNEEIDREALDYLANGGQAGKRKAKRFSVGR